MLLEILVDSSPYAIFFFTSLLCIALRRAILANYLVQTSVSLVLSSLLSVHFDNREFVSKAVTFSMLSPNLLAIVGVPTHVLELSSLLSLVRDPLSLDVLLLYECLFF